MKLIYSILLFFICNINIAQNKELKSILLDYVDKGYVISDEYKINVKPQTEYKLILPLSEQTTYLILIFCENYKGIKCQLMTDKLDFISKYMNKSNRMVIPHYSILKCNKILIINNSIEITEENYDNDYVTYVILLKTKQ